MSIVRLVSILEQNGEHHCVRESQLTTELLIGRPNLSDATDVFVTRSIFRMSHGLTNIALALPPFPADAEGRYRRMR
jgi:hypothetical protein